MTGGEIVSIVVAVITAISTILGVIISVRASQDKVMAELKTHQAVTDTKLETLAREVREHNNFARRLPIVEEQMKSVNHRIQELENERRGA